MTLDQLTHWFGWISILNILFFTLAATTVIVARDSIAALHHRLFGIEREGLHRAYFAYLAGYKLLIIVFAVVPWLALLIIG
ncbi:MAG: DUF6868 family protein [Pseudomonadota bacterium]